MSGQGKDVTVNQVNRSWAGWAMGYPAPQKGTTVKNAVSVYGVKVQGDMYDGMGIPEKLGEGPTQKIIHLKDGTDITFSPNNNKNTGKNSRIPTITSNENGETVISDFNKTKTTDIEVSEGKKITVLNSSNTNVRTSKPDNVTHNSDNVTTKPFGLNIK